MRRLLLVASTVSAFGCNALLGIHEHPASEDGGVDAVVDPCIGVCECKVDSDCAGAHAICDDEGVSRTCGCAAGYAQASPGTCTFIGIVQDPTFTDPSKWIAEQGAVVDPTAVPPPNGGDVGAGLLKGQQYCLGTSRLSQTVVMPRASRAEPLVAVLAYSTNEAFGAPAYGIGTTWNENLGFAETFGEEERQCLGPGQFAPETSTGAGVAMPLTLMPAFGVDCFDPKVAQLAISHFEIVPANPGECPSVLGAIPDGDAESGSGWQIFKDGAATVGFVDGVGEGGTRGLELKMNQSCDDGEVALAVPIPTSGALGVYTVFTGQVSMFAGLPGIDAQVPNTPNVPTTIAGCIPAGQRGTIGTFFGEAFAQPSGSAVCTDPLSAKVIFDDVRAIPDVGCGEDPAIADPGFESVLPLTSTFQQAGDSVVAKVVDPTQAHTGASAMVLAMPTQCSSAEWFSSFIAGDTAGGAGPALAFSYRTSSRSHTTLFVNGARVTTVTDGAWHDGHVCTDPAMHGRDLSMVFELEESGANPACGKPAVAADTIFIDDLHVTTDPACAASD